MDEIADLADRMAAMSEFEFEFEIEWGSLTTVEQDELLALLAQRTARSASRRSGRTTDPDCARDAGGKERRSARHDLGGGPDRRVRRRDGCRRDYPLRPARPRNVVVACGF